MAFPGGFLDIRTELLMAGTWTDVSGWVMPGAGIAITRGHPDESTRTSPSSVALTADNTGGRFGQYNPVGPYYGLIGRNTPLRISVPEGTSPLFTVALASYWRWDDGSGTVVADATGRSPGTWAGTLGSQWAAGKLGGAGVFNGTDNQADFGAAAALNPAAAITVSLWVNPAAITQIGHATVLGLGGSWWLEGDAAGDNKYQWFVNNGADQALALLTLTASAWQHLALTWDGATATTYLNGVVAGTAAISGSLSAAGGSHVLAGNRSGFSRWWKGSLDECGVWDRALSFAEIAALYNGGAGLAYGPRATSYLRSETDQASYASCPDAAGLDITGDTEIQLDVTLDNWSQNQALAGKWADTGSKRSWLLALNEAGTLTFLWSANGTAFQSAVSTVAVPLPALRRQALRVTLAVATGTVTFYTSAAVANQAAVGSVLASPAWVQLGSPVVAGALAVFSSTAPVQVGWCTDAATESPGYSGFYGKVHAFRLLSGIAGIVKASPDFTVQAAGATSFADGQANTWTLAGTSEISNRKYRAHVEVASWPPSWDPTGLNVKAAINGDGPLRRLQQGNTPLQSALYRYWTKLTGSGAPVAYWPCEDLAGATQIASAVPGGQAMTLFGGPSLAADSGFASSAPIPRVQASTWWGGVPPYAATGTVVIRFIADLPGPVTKAGGQLLQFTTTGTAAVVSLMWTPFGSPTATLFLDGWTAAGGSAWPLGNLSLAPSPGLYLISIELTTSGGNVTPTLKAMPLAPGVVTSSSVAAYAGTTGSVSGVTVDPTWDPAGRPGIGLSGTDALPATALGHLGVQSALTDLAAVMTGPFQAWAAEPAGVRFARLCAEEGLAFRGQGQLSASAPMGPQAQQTLQTDLQECADADRGVMFEPRQVLGLGYRTLSSLLNQGRAVTIDYAADEASQPFTLTDDDQYTANDVTVTRTGGSSSRQQLLTGPLSVQPPPGGVGRYDTSATINLAADGQVPSEAGWLRHMGTVNEPRYPQISTDLGKTSLDPAVLYGAQDADLGDYLAVVNDPVWIPPGPVRQLAQGLTETLGLASWQITWQGVPESPYETMIADDPVYGRADTDGCTLHTGISSSATQLLADSLTGFPLWTINAPDFPFDIAMGGEQLTVTDISGPPGNFLTGDNATFDASLGNWVGAGNATLGQSATAHSGTHSMQMSSNAAGDMTAASCGAGNILTQGLPCAPGDLITASWWVLAVTVLRNCLPQIGFYTGAGALVSTLSGTAVADVVGAWAKITMTATTPATSAFCRSLAKVQATGGAGEVHLVDDAYLADVTSGATLTQSMTVTRSVNGVVKAHLAGEDIRLQFPIIVSI